MSITEFLLARIAEDEAVAREVGEVRPELLPDDREPWADPVEVEVRFPPARVLAECEAKRRIVRLHPEILTICQGCGEPYPCRTLGAHAAVYADHPDYDEAWR